MKIFFTELFEYTHFHNQNLADKFVTCHEDLSEKTIKLYSHILNAHHIWISRIESTEISFGVWDILPKEDWKAIDQMNYDKTLRILNDYDFSLTIQYTNTKGQRYNSTVQDILFHIVNHSTYHRGQIAMEMRMNGLEPLATDYILFKR